MSTILVLWCGGNDPRDHCKDEVVSIGKYTLFRSTTWTRCQCILRDTDATEVVVGYHDPGEEPAGLHSHWIVAQYDTNKPGYEAFKTVMGTKHPTEEQVKAVCTWLQNAAPDWRFRRSLLAIIYFYRAALPAVIGTEQICIADLQKIFDRIEIPAEKDEQAKAVRTSLWDGGSGLGDAVEALLQACKPSDSARS